MSVHAYVCVCVCVGVWVCDRGLCGQVALSCSLKVELKKHQELEKEKANEEKLRKQQIAKERFLGFFKKVETTASSKVNTLL